MNELHIFFIFFVISRSLSKKPCNNYVYSLCILNIFTILIYNDVIISNFCSRSKNYALIDFVPKRDLYREIASFSLSEPTTTAEPFFIKLTERSFVRIDNPKSP